MVPTMGDPNGRNVLPRAITINVRFRAAKGNLQPPTQTESRKCWIG